MAGPATLRAATVLAAALVGSACESKPAPLPSAPAAESVPSAPTPPTASAPPTSSGGDSTGEPAPPKGPKPKVKAKRAAAVKPSPDDPLKGHFTLADATKGLATGKTIIASIETSMGALDCTLFDDKAPITVANFVGLARGLRPWKTVDGSWEKKPAYDGTIFHRVRKGFMIQGGDTTKQNGKGQPGYVIPNEIWEDANHDRAGLLCMANRGPDTNGAQFYITDDAAPSLDGSYTIFGECAPVDLVHKIASLPVIGDLPSSPPVIKTISVTRK